MINTGPLRGSGRQAVGATINLVALWGFGVPLAATLGFHYELGVRPDPALLRTHAGGALWATRNRNPSGVGC